VIRQNDWTARTDLEPRTNVNAALLKDLDLADQMVNVEHDAIADEAIDALPNDSRGHQVELVDLVADHQRVPGVVTTLEANDPLGMIGQPVNDLAFALITPLCPHDHHILSHSRDPFL